MLRRPVDGRVTAQRVGALIAACLAGGVATLALAPPAYAEDADLRLEIRSGQLDLKTDGDAQVLRLAVINDGPSPVSAAVANVQAPLGGRGVTIGNTSHSCTPVNGPSAITCQLGAMNPGQTIDVTIELKPPGEGAVQPGENVNENGNAWVTNPAGGDPNNGNDGGQFTATLAAGEQQGGEVNEVSGQVADGDSGAPLEGATVEVTDSTGRTGSTTTDGDGRFKYLAEPPLQAGRITVKATKAGYETTRTTVDAEGGSVNDVQLAVSKAEAVPPPTPTAAPTTAPPSQAPAAAADDDDSSSLLVVILISAIATTILAGAALWIGLRRNRDNEPAYVGDMGFQSPVRPVNLDAPTVQLRLPDVGGGTRVMPTLGSPEADATQQIPVPDNTQLGYPPAGTPIAYDQTAPFGPPPTSSRRRLARGRIRQPCSSRRRVPRPSPTLAARCRARLTRVPGPSRRRPARSPNRPPCSPRHRVPRPSPRAPGPSRRRPARSPNRPPCSPRHRVPRPSRRVPGPSRRQPRRLTCMRHSPICLDATRRHATNRSSPTHRWRGRSSRRTTLTAGRVGHGTPTRCPGPRGTLTRCPALRGTPTRYPALRGTPTRYRASPRRPARRRRPSHRKTWLRSTGARLIRLRRAARSCGSRRLRRPHRRHSPGRARCPPRTARARRSPHYRLR